jgi:hypothetical protein
MSQMRTVSVEELTQVEGGGIFERVGEAIGVVVGAVLGLIGLVINEILGT